MKTVLKCIAIHTILWIAVESLYTRVCREGFEPFLDSCFYFSDSKGNYLESVEACRSFNPSAWLFVPHNENEVEALRSKLSEVYDNIPRYIRLGIKQLPGLPTKEGWHWGSGKEIARGSWCTNEPNDWDGYNERDLLLLPDPDFCFLDTDEKFSAHYICKQEIPVYCPENYRLYNGRCFGVHDNELSFTMAEKQCNKLPGGHLAAFRSQEELDFIKILIGTHNMWIGLTDEANERNWTFTDGTTLPEGVTFTQVNGGKVQNCALLNVDCLFDQFCTRRYPYACMTMAYMGVLLNMDDPSECLRPLFDLDTKTCLNVKDTIFNMAEIGLELLIPQNIEDGLLRLYFSQNVICETKQAIYEFKESTKCDKEYLKACDLVTTGSGTRTSCEYRCRCEQDQCRILLVDDSVNASVDLCEITYQ